MDIYQVLVKKRYEILTRLLNEKYFRQGHPPDF